MEEDKKEQKTEKNVMLETKEEVEKLIERITEGGIDTSNIELLFKLTDIHKDIENEKYWKKKEEFMMYRGYNYDDSYGRQGVKGTGPYSRYRENNTYGRRGVPGTGRGRYRGEELIDDMYKNYQEYSDGKEMYGADNETMESFKYMVKSFRDYYKHLKENASSNEEMQILDQAIEEMARM